MYMFCLSEQTHIKLTLKSLRYKGNLNTIRKKVSICLSNVWVWDRASHKITCIKTHKYLYPMQKEYSSFIYKE